MIFSRFEKTAMEWDNCGVLAMCRKGGPNIVASFPTAMKARIVADRRRELAAELSALSPKPTQARPAAQAEFAL
jgi:hypothetical protein